MEQNRDKTEKELTGRARSLANLKRDAGPGRPKGQRNYSDIYKDAMIMLANKNNTTPEALEAEMVANAAVLARKGDYRFYKDTLDRLHGTATNKSELKVEGALILPSELIEKNDTSSNTKKGSEQQESL